MTLSARVAAAALRFGLLVTVGLFATCWAAASEPSFALHTLEGGAQAGTLGVGMLADTAWRDDVHLRVGLNALHRHDHESLDGLAFQGTRQMRSLELLGDWYPTTSGFRLTAGVFYTDSRIDLQASPGTAPITLNGHTYTDVQSIAMAAKFAPLAPYLGIGWGSRLDTPGLHVTADLGVIDQGSSRVEATVVSTQSDTALQSDVNTQRQAMQGVLNGRRWYPIAEVGLLWRF